MEQTKILVKLELCNLYGFNVLRNTKDVAERRKKYALTAVIGVALILLMSYIAGQSYMLIHFGAGHVIPAFLTVFATFVSLFFGIFKAGGTIFRKKGYEMISALPLKDGAVIFSRIFRLYIENLILTALVMLPGSVVFLVMEGASLSFVVSILAGILFVPMIPSALAAAISTMIQAASSRAKHKGIIEAILSLFLVVLVFVLFSGSPTPIGEINEDAVRDLVNRLGNIFAKIYPPAGWLSDSAKGSLSSLLLFLGVSILLYELSIWIIAKNYHRICRGLFVNSARHDYQMRAQQKSSLFHALVSRESKLYFSSGIYISNTIFGPAFALVFCIALLFLDVDTIMAQLPALPTDVDFLRAIPFLFAGILCMSSPVCASISMEGKEWWIVKSLPLPEKDIVNAKLVFSLELLAPFYLISEIIFMASQSISLMERLWFLLVPVFAALFVCSLGIWINLKLPKMKWESATEAVKQSASTALGGVLPPLLVVLIGFGSAVIASDLYPALICVLMAFFAWFFHRAACRVNLQNIE